MMELTKERLMALSNRENVGAICSDEIVAMARQLLAWMEQEPVAIVDVQSGRTDGSKLALVYRPAMHKQPDDVYYLYAAPQLPQPVVVPDFVGKLIGILDRHTIELGWGEKPITLAELVTSRDGEEELSACRAAMLQGAEPVHGWIPCSERMPETMVSVLATGDWFDYAVTAWSGKEWLDLDDYEPPVTHWMPLPAVPQQEVKP